MSATATTPSLSSSLSLSPTEKATLRTAAYGAVSLLAAADSTGRPGKIAAHGSMALNASTGPVGHVLAEKGKVHSLSGKSVAEIADKVLPALTEAVTLLAARDASAADDFRTTVELALATGTHARKGGATPVMTAMTTRITSAMTTK
ncbi:hypothetical protein ACIBI4_10130 [Streptomyces sp. NPDC050418]|uniref:hypothetical protein n=1 Tax=Streptomyces sp. NPDC050418 TaxID=3365612 RepID=UPI003792168F